MLGDDMTVTASLRSSFSAANPVSCSVLEEQSPRRAPGRDALWMSHGNLAVSVTRQTPRASLPGSPAPQTGNSGHRGFSIDLETLFCLGEFSLFLSW